MSNKVIITAALLGGATPKEKNENIPMTPEEIAEDAYNCWKAGAAVVHLHMRDENYKGSMDRDKFEQTIKLIRSHKDCDVIINCSSSGEYGASDLRRMEHFKTVKGIEIGSYDTGTFNWGGNGTFYNTPDFLKKLGKVYQDYNIKPECEIFDMGMLSNADWLYKNRYMTEPLLMGLILGVVGGMEATVENLVYLVNNLPPNVIWSASGIGNGHLPIMYAAIALGGNVRVGLEDNVYYAHGVKATNVMLVERAARAIKECGKEVATPSEARKIIGIRQLV